MNLVHFWVIRTLALPTAVLLGVAGAGCSGGAGTGNSGGSGNGGGGSGGGGGDGGSACTPEAEICDNKDNDCDGAVDDMGNETCGVGACAAVVKRCVAGQEQTCVPGQPTVEICDGLDNDCNGTVDESDPMLAADCVTDELGVCAAGQLECIGQVLVCAPGAAPEDEICDGLDNDCNGAVDDVLDFPDGCVCRAGDQQPCYTGPEGTAGVSNCVAGVQSCVGGTWGPCNGQILPKDEVCNLIDDDCDGAVDDMGVTACGIGACAALVANCTSGQVQTCVPGQPSLEVCDGIDNNCNQLIDESDPMVGAACDTGNLGVCAVGKIKCAGATLVCAPNLVASGESCDGFDNDCDGAVDDNIPGTGGVCSTGFLGVCAAGTIACKLAGGMFAIDCYPNFEASPEICDGFDNNCNGNIDENGVCP